MRHMPHLLKLEKTNKGSSRCGMCFIALKYVTVHTKYKRIQHKQPLVIPKLKWAILELNMDKYEFWCKYILICYYNNLLYFYIILICIFIDILFYLKQTIIMLDMSEIVPPAHLKKLKYKFLNMCMIDQYKVNFSTYIRLKK